MPDEPTLADGPPSELRIDAGNTTTPDLADKPTFANGSPPVIEHRFLEYWYTKLGRQTYFGRWSPHSILRIDALNTSAPNLADEPTLTNGPPVLTSSGPDWQFHIATDVQLSRMAISHCY